MYGRSATLYIYKIGVIVQVSDMLKNILKCSSLQQRIHTSICVPILGTLTFTYFFSNYVPAFIRNALDKVIAGARALPAHEAVSVTSWSDQ